MLQIKVSNKSLSLTCLWHNRGEETENKHKMYFVSNVPQGHVPKNSMTYRVSITTLTLKIRTPFLIYCPLVVFVIGRGNSGEAQYWTVTVSQNQDLGTIMPPQWHNKEIKGCLRQRYTCGWALYIAVWRGQSGRGTREGLHCLSCPQWKLYCRHW